LLTVILNLEWLNVQKLASFLSLRYFSKTVRLINFLRLAGLPPLSGFFIKLFLLKVLIFSAPSFLILLLLISSLIVLYAYIIISYYVLRTPFSITNFNTTKTPVLFLRIISLSWGALPILFLLSS
jgi:NADH:ubiquinone oxidoreductase subunit 2 (subunit N)